MRFNLSQPAFAIPTLCFSTGDIFRANAKGETPLGVEATKYMDAGDFVPESVTNKMVRDRLSDDDVESGFRLDGYLRTTAQVDCVDEILANGEQKLDVLQLTADDEEPASTPNLFRSNQVQRSFALPRPSTVGIHRRRRPRD